MNQPSRRRIDTTPEQSDFLRTIKHIVEISIIIAALPFWGMMCVLIYLAILFEDGHNPIFKQERLGKDGRMFYTFKFRTMVPDAEKVLERMLAQDEQLRQEWELFYKLRQDPRITRIGRFLRRTSLDELPQLINVLRGEMALVGPRPLSKYHLNALPDEVCRVRATVKPGITGMWQVSGRSDAGNDGFKRWDPYYVKNWSLALDVHILLRTVRVVLNGKGAY